MSGLIYLEFVKNLSDNDLKVAGNEIIEFKNTSILPDGILKKVKEKVRSVIGHTGYEYAIVERIVIDEIINRYCK